VTDRSETPPAEAAKSGHDRDGRITTYAKFWPYYLEEHRKPFTRGLHYFGTMLAIALLVVAIATQTWWLLIAVPVSGYLFAWIGHFFVEKNRPATFTYPLWSLASDFVMLFRWLTGRLGGDLKRHRISDTPSR
jgi:hypothetical protein